MAKAPPPGGRWCSVLVLPPTGRIRIAHFACDGDYSPRCKQKNPGGPSMTTTRNSGVRTRTLLALGAVFACAGCPPKPMQPQAVRTAPTQAESVPLQLQTAIAVDKDGNRILAGSFVGNRLSNGTSTLPNRGRTDIFVVKLDKLGRVVFSQSFGGVGDDAATGVAVDNADGSIVV